MPVPTPGGLWRKIAPAVLLGGALFLSLAIACSLQPEAAINGLFLGILYLLAANPDYGLVIRRLLTVNFFILFLFLVVPFTSQGPYLWEYGILKLSRPGLEICILIAIKSNAIVLIFLALVAPMSVATLGAALTSLGCPDRLAWLFLLMERNLQILGRTWQTVSEAAALRGFVPKSRLSSYRTYAAMLAIFFLRCHDRSNSMRDAMLLAGFDGKIPFRRRLHFGYQEALFTLLIIASVILVMGGIESWQVLCLS